MNNKTALSIDYSWLEALKETDRKLICYLAYNTDLVEMKHLTSSSLKNPFRNVSDIKERLERLTQEMLAAKLQVEGCDITRSAVAKIEVGQRHLYPDELILLKKILKTTYDAILDIEA